LARSRRRPGAFSWYSPTTGSTSGRRPAAARVRRRSGGAAAKSERFTGKSGSALDIVAPAGLKATRLIVIGTGKADERKPPTSSSSAASRRGAFRLRDRGHRGAGTRHGAVKADAAADVALGASMRAYRSTATRPSARRRRGPSKAR
jgi:hypothetical protein